MDLTGSGLARLGADERLCSGDYAGAQRWALALWAHPQRPDGILYRARHDPSRLSVAVFDRAAARLEVRRLMRLTDDQSQLAALLDTYNFGLRGAP